jgi:hypothetical protein
MLSRTKAQHSRKQRSVLVMQLQSLAQKIRSQPLDNQRFPRLRAFGLCARRRLSFPRAPLFATWQGCMSYTFNFQSERLSRESTK